MGEIETGVNTLSGFLVHKILQRGSIYQSFCSTAVTILHNTAPCSLQNVKQRHRAYSPKHRRRPGIMKLPWHPGP